MADRRLLTNQEVVDLIKAETGKSITVATFRSYVARGQAPAPVERRANSPFYSRKQALEWIHNRPGSGARRDITKTKPRTTPAEPSSAPVPDNTTTPETSTTARPPRRRRPARADAREQ